MRAYVFEHLRGRVYSIVPRPRR